MKASKRSKFITEVPTTEVDVIARRPFKVESDNRRRFIRLEIAAPMSLQKIKDSHGNFWPEGEWHLVNGTILNVSAGGVLVELDQSVNEGDIVAMHFTLQGVEELKNILGLVKRADFDGEGVLAGIEFVTHSFLSDRLSRPEIDLLTETCCNFDDSVRQVLTKYVHHESR